MLLLGIIVSTPGEADLLVGSLNSKTVFTYQHKDFFSGSINGRMRAVICICGVGKTNAAHGTALLMERFAPGHVYSIGVAGAYPGSGLRIGDVAVADDEIYGDEGIITGSGFHTIDAIGIPLASVGGIDYYNKFPLVVPDFLRDCGPTGNFVTVSSCTGTTTAAKDMEDRFHAICENMEGAAIAHVCALNEVPFTEVRGVSNVVGDRDARPLEAGCIRLASERVQGLLIEKLTA
ncbi:MAG: futalosine hydrolase [Nitrospirae bacterium]|nr:futalosine hydrolase [Nitrospirota bacterium]